MLPLSECPATSRLEGDHPDSVAWVVTTTAVRGNDGVSGSCRRRPNGERLASVLVHSVINLGDAPNEHPSSRSTT